MSYDDHPDSTGGLAERVAELERCVRDLERTKADKPKGGKGDPYDAGRRRPTR